MKSTDLMKSADEARRLLRGFKAFAEVAEALEAAGQAAQAKEEAERLLAELQPQLVKAKEDLQVQKSLADGLKLSASQIVEDAKTHAAERVQAAKLEAEKIVADAQTKAANAIHRAATRSTEYANEAVGFEKQRDAARAELAELEAKIAQAKAQINKLLG